MEKTFQFELDDKVKLELSYETGMVIGRAEFTTKDPQYLVRYKAADGRLVETWWDEDAILAA